VGTKVFQNEEEFMARLLEVNDLRTQFFTQDGIVNAVNGITYILNEGETLGIVGESGSGKSVGVMSLIRLIPTPPGKIVGGEVNFDGRNLLKMSDSEIRSIRGNKIGMIFQDPMTSLNPVLTIGRQISEALELHLGMDKAQSRARTVELLELVGIPSATDRIDDYPHQFSGGMRQRAMIAMALSCNPRLLIADEPTTALDVTIQAQILELMKGLQAEMGMAILMITHDLGVIAEMADHVAVMYMGKIVESADTRTIFNQPLHPYTVGLMRSIPHLGSRSKGRARLTPIPGSVPDPFSVPSGCAFYPRCPAPKTAACQQEVPLRELEPGHFVRCTLYE
jgi:oligopeptide/dipeptide ABC transporter ATP-binding protein